MQHAINAWLEQLRDLLSEAPPLGSVEDAATSWEALCGCIDQAPPDLPDALWRPYVEGHLACWPDDARAPTPYQLRHLDPSARWLVLCRSFTAYYDTEYYDLETLFEGVLSEELLLALLPNLPATLTRLTFEHASPRILEALPGLIRRLSGLVALDLARAEITPHLLGAILDALPQPQVLRVLDLSLTRLGSVGARLLAEAPLTGLESLNLEYAEVTEEGTRALGASPHLVALTDLTLDSGAFSAIGEDLALYAGLPNLLRVLEGGVSPWDLFSSRYNIYYNYNLDAILEEPEEASPPAPRRVGGRAGGVPRRRGPRRGALGAHLRAVRLGWADAPLLDLAGLEPSALGARLQRGEPPLEDLLRAAHADLEALAGLDRLDGDAVRALRDVLRVPDPRAWGQRRWIAAHPEVRCWLELRRAQLTLAPYLFGLGAPEDPAVLRGAVRGASLVVQAFAAILVRHHHPALPAHLVYQRLGAPHLEFAPPEVWEEALMLGP